jgi:protein subunit release factor B
MLFISHSVSIPLDQLQLTAMRSQGAGGQKNNETIQPITVGV